MPDCSNIRKDRPLSDRIALEFGTTEKPDRGCNSRSATKALSGASWRDLQLCGKTHADWHSACNVESAVSLGKKRWGKRFFVICSCRACAVRDSRGPLIESLIFTFRTYRPGAGNTGRILRANLVRAIYRASEPDKKSANQKEENRCDTSL